ncbi:MAG: hypothetical protein ACJ8F1_17010 [Polyangia bacterium]
MFDVSARSPSPARFRHKRAIVVVALGFLATCVPPMATYAPFLVNRTTAVADVRITWVLAKVDCASSPDALARTLNPSDLDDPRTVSLTSGQVAALDQPSLPGQSPAGLCRLGPFVGSTPSPCIAAVLESDGATPVLMVAPPGWIVSGNDGLSSCGATTPPPSRCQATLDPAVDPGVDAVSLVLRKNGQTQFAVSSQAADAKVRIAPIDLSAVAARPSASGGCRSLRDAYHAELANSACVTNSDCDVVPLLELPGETRPVSGCGSYLNRTAAAKVRAVSRSFALCQGGPLTCETPDPPGCVGGQCTAICAGETLPYCPPNCTHFPGVSFGEGETCNTNIVCFAADGRRCHCAVNTLTVACAGDLPISPSCPYSCRPSVHYSDDAGSPNYVDRTDAGGDGTTDGGTVDAHGG